MYDIFLQCIVNLQWHAVQSCWEFSSNNNVNTITIIGSVTKSFYKTSFTEKNPNYIVI